MKAMIFYRDNSEHGSAVREFLRELGRRTNKTLQEIDPDSISGISLAELYEVVEYPTIIATDDDGKLLNTWRGQPLPTISEVSYYA